jgi:hypothetical protein
MKLSHVSLLLVVLAACEEEPLAPDLRRPTLPSQDAPVVITGRVVRSGSTIGIEGAYLRVIEANAIARPDESGRYRLVLPASFRGRTVVVKVLAIGFNARNEIVTLNSDTVALDLAMSVYPFRLDCVVMTQVGVMETPEPDVTIRTPAPVPGKQKLRAVN